MEVGGSVDRYRPHAAIEETLVSGKAGKKTLPRHRKLGAECLHAVSKVVRPGEYLVSPVGREKPRHPDAPAPAADDSQLDLWVGLGAPDEVRPQEGVRHRAWRRPCQETTPPR